MPKIILTKGLPASGKSTWAKAWVKEDPVNRKRVCRDDLRLMFHDVRFDSKLEQCITMTTFSLIKEFIEYGYSIVVDETNLNLKYKIEEAIDTQLENANAKEDYTIEWKDFTDVPMKTCIQRDKERAHSVGSKVIKRMYYTHIAPFEHKQYVPDESLPKAILCDLDGTLSLVTGRSPYDGEKCLQDEVCEEVLDIIETYHKKGYKILFMSGRMGTPVATAETMKWLKKHLPADMYADLSLSMREDGDSRPDHITKDELFMKTVDGKYNVKFCLDDRDQVVEMWRAKGLKVLQVADGDF